MEKASADKNVELQSDRNVLRLRNEVISQQARIIALEKALQSQRIAVAQTEEIVRLSLRTYQLGKGSLVELLGSQNDLINAKATLVATQLDLASTARQLAWNLGVTVP